MYRNGWLDAASNTDHPKAVPLIIIGYSFGACLAYECAGYIEYTLPVVVTDREMQKPLLMAVDQLVLIAAPSREDLRNVQLFDATPDSFRSALLANMGVIPKVFVEFLKANDSSPAIVTEMLSLGVQDQKLQQQWCVAFDQRELGTAAIGGGSGNKLKCNIVCITGESDKAVRSSWWATLCSRGDGAFVDILYPEGNDFHRI